MRNGFRECASRRSATNRRERLVVLLVALAAACLAACGGDAERETASAPRSAEEELRRALAEPDGLERTRGLVEALSGLDSGKARRLAEIMGAWPEPIPAYELRLLYSAWAARDADAAMEYVLSLSPEVIYRQNVAAEVVRTVAGREPSKARIWVTSLPEGESEEFRLAMIVALVEGWPASTEGYEGVSDLIQAMPLGFARERAVRALIEGLIEDGELEATLRWAETIPLSAPGQFRAMVFRKVAVTADGESRPRVAEWLDSHRTERPGQAGLRVLARAWAEEDPEEALRWALAQPDDRGRFLSVKFAFQTFYEQDRAAAKTWLAAQPASPALDPARLSYALSELYVEPEAAATGALEIQDEVTRDDILGKVVRHWLGRDPEGAQAWMEASELSQDDWTVLLAPKDRPSARSHPAEPEGEDGAGRPGRS